MKKKLTAVALVVCMLAIMLVGASLAYFTDTDADVNVMTTGNLKIDQTENFEQGAALLPSPNYDDCANNVEKDVFVTNEGNVPAYLRTLFALEDTRDLCTEIKVCTDYEANWVTPSNGTNDWLQFEATIRDTDGNVTSTVYTVSYIVYPAILAPNGTTGRLLDHVTLSGNADNRWSEVAGDEWELMVLSQAVQTAGFAADDTIFVAEEAAAAFEAESSFGAIDYTDDAKVAEWFKPLIESNLEEDETLVSVEAFAWVDNAWNAN